MKRYPKLIFFLITLIAAYFLFQDRSSIGFDNFVSSLGYLGIFFTGLLYSYGFTSGFASSAFLVMDGDYNIFLAGILGGLGALFSDIVIFRFFKSTFYDEVERLSREKFIVGLSRIIPGFIKKTALPVLGAVIIASPLPDELGVSLMASSKKLPPKTFAIISFFLNTAGVISLLYLGKSLLGE